MKRLKGPELKMPELKMPPFLTDLYWDLRDRRLLPLVGLVIVAIVAVPFLLGGGSEESPPPASPPVAAISGTADADTSRLTVVEAKPGLRDYRKRLRWPRADRSLRTALHGPAGDGGGAGWGTRIDDELDQHDDVDQHHQGHEDHQPVEGHDHDHHRNADESKGGGASRNRNSPSPPLRST